MAKSTAQRVREAEASHRARGEREIRVWVPAERAEELRRIAREMREKPTETGRQLKHRIFQEQRK